MLDAIEKYDNLLFPANFEAGKMRFLEGTLSFNAGFSSILTAKNYEFWLTKIFSGKIF